MVLMTRKENGEEKERAEEEGEITAEVDIMGITIKATKTLEIMHHLDNNLEVVITMQVVKEDQDTAINLLLMVTRVSRGEIKAKGDIVARTNSSNRTGSNTVVIREAKIHI